MLSAQVYRDVGYLTRHVWQILLSVPCSPAAQREWFQLGLHSDYLSLLYCLLKASAVVVVKESDELLAGDYFLFSSACPYVKTILMIYGVKNDLFTV